MNSKGFTLIELLSVVVILALLSLIALPSVTNIVANNKTKLYDIQINNIKDAMKSYVSENATSFPNNGTVYLTLYQLASDNYIDKAIKNPLTGENFSLDTILKISLYDVDNQYEVIVSDDDIVYNDDEISNLPKLKLVKNYGSDESNLNNNISLATINGIDSKSSVQIEEKYSLVYFYSLEDSSSNLKVTVIYNANF